MTNALAYDKSLEKMKTYFRFEISRRANPIKLLVSLTYTFDQ